jgi:DnaK suppressor protein
MKQEDIKQLLLKEISKTETLIEEYKEMSGPVAPDDAIGRISRMDAINNQSVTEASLRQAEQKLKNLQRVLSQVGSKEFGNCLKCRKPIPVERILYRPESLYCVNCAK